MTRLRCTCTCRLLAGALLLLPVAIRAQERSAGTPIVTTRFENAVRVGEAIELQLNKALAPDAGRLAVVIGQTDWSGLLESTERGVVLRRTPVPLPAGEYELAVYLVSKPNDWQLLSRQQLRVIDAPVPPRTEIDPTFEITNKGQVAAGRQPSTGAARATFQDFTLNGAIRTTLSRGGWATMMQMGVLGVSNREEALRAREQPNTAPLVDLGEYVVRTENDRLALALGHVNFGSHPHLLNQFASRGALAAVRFGSRADVALSALHGSPIVGWDHFVGFDRPEHRVVAATVGLEMFAAHPGAFRLETSVMSGKVLPLTGINEGRVNDVEESHGAGLRLTASDFRRRFRVDSGFARSSFLNPNDALRLQGSTAAPLPELTRNAHYLDLSYAVLQERPVGTAARANLVAAYRRERVDPQYGSVVADVRSDLSQDAFDVRGDIAGATMQVAYARAHDNLDAISTLARTFTRMIQVNVAAPLGAVWRTGSQADGPATNGGWWPVVTYTLNRIHQWGTGFHMDTAAAGGELPDQIATDQSLGFDWFLSRLRVGYRVNRTYQDNRQKAAGNADLANLIHDVRVDFAAGSAIELQMAAAFERAENEQLARIDYTRRFGLNGVWRLPWQTVLTGVVSTSALNDGNNTTDAGDLDFSVEVAKTLAFFGNEAGTRRAQLFVRYSRQAAHQIDRVFAINDRRRVWTFNTGFNVTLF